MVTLENWRERMSEDMRLRDFRPRTQEGYALAVRQFLDRMAREPATLTDEDVRVYFLYLREDKKLAPSSINIAVHALRFFFIHTLHRDWPVFDLLRVNKPRMLPVVLSTNEVRAVLSAALHRRRFRRQQRRSHDRHQPQRRQRTPLGQRNTCVQRSKITSTSCATRSGDALSWAHAATAAHGAFNARVASPRSSARHGLKSPVALRALQIGFVQQAL
jgi:hypothetical protein